MLQPFRFVKTGISAVYISVGVTPASSGGGQPARLSGGYQSPTESSLRQDDGDAQWKAPMAPRILASSLPAADLNRFFTLSGTGQR